MTQEKLDEINKAVEEQKKQEERQEELDIQKEQTNAINEQTTVIQEQTNAINEQHETSKGIWGTIKEVLSYINPFSENFFVYKMLDLLYEGLKALFIPSDDFFANWFSDLNDTFKDQFGILYYPVSVTIDFLSTFNEKLVEQDPIIRTPAFNLKFMDFDKELLPATEYDFNTLLENETFAKVHSFYLMFVNIVLTIGLIIFAKKIAVEIFGGINDTVDTAVYNSQADARAYNNYARQQNAKKAYIKNSRSGGKK